VDRKVKVSALQWKGVFPLSGSAKLVGHCSFLYEFV